MNSAQLIVASGALLALASSSALACVMMPPQPPPVFWVEDHGDTDGDGLTNFWVGMEVSLFAAGVPTNCACGLGLTGPTSGLLEIDGVSITETNLLTHVSTPVTEFSTLGANINTSNGLNGIGTGDLWFGFSGLVLPTFPTVPGPDSVFKIWFDVDAPDLASLAGAFGTIAAGEADEQGFPLLDGPHAIQLFSPANNTLVPAPGALALFAGASLLTTRRRR